MSRRRRQQRLERVLGTPALFSTAYGNVGSSIYYALGVTAVFALGLTPVVFVIAGIFFAATALSYAEGTVRYPEAGGSASFARHAFNELVSFGLAWAQMLNYIITIAISAFFVPHYLSIFWEPVDVRLHERLTRKLLQRGLEHAVVGKPLAAAAPERGIDLCLALGDRIPALVDLLVDGRLLGQILVAGVQLGDQRLELGRVLRLRQPNGRRLIGARTGDDHDVDLGPKRRLDVFVVVDTVVGQPLPQPS